jgi:hypothetical protein
MGHHQGAGHSIRGVTVCYGRGDDGDDGLTYHEHGRQ